MAEIPLDQAADQIAAGTVAPTSEQHMLDTDGNPQIVDPSSVRLALQKGYKLVPQAVAEHVAAVHEAAQHPVEAAALGAARGTVPFAPSLIAAVGGPSLERQQLIKEGSPTADTLGEVGGNILQAGVVGALTGGAGDVAKAGSLGSRVFDAADMAKQAAIFGGQGASNEINEQDLDHGYNGEAILSQAGLGAVLGAASSPAFALAREVLPNPITAAGKAISKASDALTSALGRTAGEGGVPAAQSIGKLGAQKALNKSATDLADGLQDTVDKSFDQMSRVHEDMKPDQVRALSEQDAAQSGHTVGKTAKAFDAFMNGYKPPEPIVPPPALDPEIARGGFGWQEPGWERPSITEPGPEIPKPTAPPVAPTELAPQSVNDTLAQLNAVRPNGKMIYNSAIVDHTEQAMKILADGAKSGTSMLDFQEAAHKAGRYLDDNVMKYAKNLDPSIDSAVHLIEKNIRTPLRQMLREPEIMGPRLAAANGALTDAEHALFQSTGALYRGLGFTDLLADGRPADQSRISASRVLTNLRNADKLGQQQNNAVISRFLEDAKNLNDVAAQVAKDGGQTTNTDEIQNLLRDQATKQAQGQATARLAGSGGGNSMNGGMGYSVGGFGPEVAAGLLGHAATMATGVPGLGAAAGLATRGVRMVKHPASTLEMLGKIKAAADKHTADIAKGAASFFTGAGRVVAPVTAGNALKAGRDPYEDGSDTEKRMAEVRNLSSNPTLLENTLRSNTTALADGAPVTALAVQVNAQARLKVLQAALPPQPPQGMIRQKVPQSIDAVQKFERTLDVVNHPAKAIQSAAIDERLTPDMVAAADAAAPKTMANIRAAYQNEMVDRYDHDYTLGQKQMLSVLFKAPVTPDVAPLQVAFLQATFAPPSPTPPPGAPGKPRAGGLAKLNPGAAIATPTQARQMEKNA